MRDARSVASSMVAVRAASSGRRGSAGVVTARPVRSRLAIARAPRDVPVKRVTTVRAVISAGVVVFRRRARLCRLNGSIVTSPSNEPPVVSYAAWARMTAPSIVPSALPASSSLTGSPREVRSITTGVVVSPAVRRALAVRFPPRARRTSARPARWAGDGHEVGQRSEKCDGTPVKSTCEVTTPSAPRELCVVSRSASAPASSSASVISSPVAVFSPVSSRANVRPARVTWPPTMRTESVPGHPSTAATASRTASIVAVGVVDWAPSRSVIDVEVATMVRPRPAGATRGRMPPATSSWPTLISTEEPPPAGTRTPRSHRLVPRVAPRSTLTGTPRRALRIPLTSRPNRRSSPSTYQAPAPAIATPSSATATTTRTRRRFRGVMDSQYQTGSTAQDSGVAERDLYICSRMLADVGR